MAVSAVVMVAVSAVVMVAVSAVVMVAGCGCISCGALGDGGWMWLYQLW